MQNVDKAPMYTNTQYTYLHVRYNKIGKLIHTIQGKGYKITLEYVDGILLYMKKIPLSIPLTFIINYSGGNVRLNPEDGTGRRNNYKI